VEFVLDTALKIQEVAVEMLGPSELHDKCNLVQHIGATYPAYEEDMYTLERYVREGDLTMTEYKLNAMLFIQENADQIRSGGPLPPPLQEKYERIRDCPVRYPAFDEDMAVVHSYVQAVDLEMVEVMLLEVAEALADVASAQGLPTQLARGTRAPVRTATQPRWAARRRGSLDSNCPAPRQQGSAESKVSIGRRRSGPDVYAMAAATQQLTQESAHGRKLGEEAAREKSLEEARQGKVEQAAKKARQAAQKARETAQDKVVEKAQAPTPPEAAAGTPPPGEDAATEATATPGTLPSPVESPRERGEAEAQEDEVTSMPTREAPPVTGQEQNDLSSAQEEPQEKVGGETPAIEGESAVSVAAELGSQTQKKNLKKRQKKEAARKKAEEVSMQTLEEDCTPPRATTKLTRETPHKTQLHTAIPEVDASRVEDLNGPDPLDDMFESSLKNNEGIRDPLSAAFEAAISQGSDEGWR